VYVVPEGEMQFNLSNTVVTACSTCFNIQKLYFAWSFLYMNFV
jgi:hypothetical protein